MGHRQHQLRGQAALILYLAQSRHLVAVVAAQIVLPLVLMVVLVVAALKTLQQVLEIRHPRHQAKGITAAALLLALALVMAVAVVVLLLVVKRGLHHQ